MNQWSSQQTSNYDRDKFDICDRCGLNQNVFYRWQKVFFENGAAAFNQAGNDAKLAAAGETRKAQRKKESIVMKRILTIMKDSAKILPVGETDVRFAEEQLTGDNQLKATNCRWAGGYNTCHPILRVAKIIQSVVMPKKPPPQGVLWTCRRQGRLLTENWICTIHAEPVRRYE